MFATMIVQEASAERYGTQNELRPIISTMAPQGEDRLETQASSGRRLQEVLSWEYFVNELEFE